MQIVIVANEADISTGEELAVWLLTCGTQHLTDWVKDMKEQL